MNLKSTWHSFKAGEDFLPFMVGVVLFGLYGVYKIGVILGAAAFEFTTH